MNINVSKKQVAEYGNIYSMLVSNFERDVTKNADITEQLLTSASKIAQGTGYEMDYVLQSLRAGLVGSSEAVDLC